jgi:hypothetical protein
MLGEAIVSRLTTAQSGDNAGQTAALGVLTASIGTQVYPGRSDRDIYPFVAYGIRQEAEDSITARAMKEFTVTLWIETRGAGAYKQAQAIKQAIRTLLDRQGGTWGGVVVKGFWFVDSEENDSSDGGNSDALFYEVEEEYHVWAAA